MMRRRLSEITSDMPIKPVKVGGFFVVRDNMGEEVVRCNTLKDLSRKLLQFIVDKMYPEGDQSTTWDIFFDEVAGVKEGVKSNEKLEPLIEWFDINTYKSVTRVGSRPNNEEYPNIYLEEQGANTDVYAIVKKYGGFIILLTPLPEGLNVRNIDKESISSDEKKTVEIANKDALYFRYASEKGFKDKFGKDLFDILKHLVDPAHYDYLSKLTIDMDDIGTKSSPCVNNEGEKMDIKIKLEEFVVSNDRQIIFNGAPGTGKTYSIREWMNANCVDSKKELSADDKDKAVWQFVQFHPSYDYTDFVEGLRPVKLSPEDKDSTFVRIDGVFKKFCRAAVEDYNKAEDKERARKYFFVIDEINRADLGKVFGELMFGLEEDYRGAENAFPTQYMNLPAFEETRDKNNNLYYEAIKDDVFKDGFFIPKNVYIIGTMNDIDRSVDSLDFAMRRRFKWCEVTAESVMETVLRDMFLKETGEETESVFGKDNSLVYELIKRMDAVNSILVDERFKKLGLTKDYCIGPAYLKDFKEYAKKLASSGKSFNCDDEEFRETLKTAWNNKIQQILINYCRGRDEITTKEFLKECRVALGVDQETSEDPTQIEK